MQSSVTAGDATTGLIQAAGDDGTYVIKTGAAGLKVNAVSYAADGTPTQIKGTTIGSAPMAVPAGSAPLFACRAWVNFNGTGTVAIRASGNVSSITDRGVGIYSVNMTVSLPDADYATGGFHKSDIDYAPITGQPHTAVAPDQTAAAFPIKTGSSGAAIDSTLISAFAFK